MKNFQKHVIYLKRVNPIINVRQRHLKNKISKLYWDKTLN